MSDVTFFRRFFGHLALSICLLWLLTGTAVATETQLRLDPEITSYFKQYCYQCHGEATQKGDRRIDQLSELVAQHSEDAQAQETLLEEALDAINRGDMPPKKKEVPQPPAIETRKVVEQLTKHLTLLTDSRSATTTTMRRLNRFEYVNTMRDLLGVRREFFELTSDFPLDASFHGFDNNGQALTLSDFQLRRYLEVAEASVDAATFFGISKPKANRWSYSGNDFNGVRSYERAPVTWRLIVDKDFIEIGHGQPKERHPNFVKAFAKMGGVPADGWYTIRLKAAAANRLDHGYESKDFERYASQHLKLALWIAPSAELLQKNASDQRQLVQVWDLPDGQPEWFTQRVQLNKGAIPFVSWTNGVKSKGTIRRVAEKYHPEVVRATKTQRDAAKLGNQDAKASVARLAANEDSKLLSEVYHGPRVRVWNLQIEGPAFESWPPASHQRLFGSETDASKINVDETVVKFAARAFRRPVTGDEVKHYSTYIRERIRQGDSPATAIKLGLAGILTSPRFLYLDEGNDEVATALTPHELATRLSYFLWSSMPDDELLSAASNRQLSTKKELSAQAERMLADPKADAFVEHFTDTWLGINKLGAMPPDSKAFGEYYRDRLQDLFKTETRMFFGDLLENNGRIECLLNSDYTFLNDTLAAFYGIPDVQGERFRKVALRKQFRRGGLLGQGSVLTLTANGIETSPVVRGVWVLENILGTPPAPPPPDVEPLEPDTRGTTTIREQLEKHRTVGACADCHQKIDPVGFALEFFDPIGGLRTHYQGRGKNRTVVNGTGQLPTGEKFDDEQDLKRLLVDRKEQFVRTLTEKIMTYAVGRSMTFQDRTQIDQLSSDCVKTGSRLRDLVVAVATSEMFRTR